MFLLFNFFNLSLFWHSFKLRYSISFICFFFSFQVLTKELEFWFSSPMHIFNKETVPIKTKFFQTMPEAYFLAKTLFFQCQWCILSSSRWQWYVSHWHWLWHCRRKRWAEKFTQITLISIIFVYLYKLGMHFLHFSQNFS